MEHGRVRVVWVPVNRRFNEAAGAYPADGSRSRRTLAAAHAPRFNEAAGAYPADGERLAVEIEGLTRASMRPRGRTPRMDPRQPPTEHTNHATLQ